jgi:hypothetical protein
MTPGLHTISAAEYHADPCPQPSLSSSIANLLLTRSPLHAWHAHPRLNPAWRAEVPTTEMELGTALHSMILENSEKSLVLIDAKDYRTNDAKALRDAARVNGKTPLLVHKLAEVREIALAARAQIKASEIGGVKFSSERSMLWQEGETWCRGRIDWLSDDNELVVDLKTTSASAEPNAYIKRLLNDGADLQAAVYSRGVYALTGKRPAFVFACIEVDPPYAMSFVGLEPAWIAWADAKFDQALEIWRKCLASNEWPAYGRRVCWGSLPAWAEAQWMERIAA